jgi:hypothetical protein
MSDKLLRVFNEAAAVITDGAPELVEHWLKS